jgi:hypothetical protein
MSQTTYRFKFNRDLLNSIKEFSKIHNEDNGDEFLEAFQDWKITNNQLIKKEEERIIDLGFKGNIEEKIYRSARYYFKNKKNNICKLKQKTIKTNYIPRNNKFFTIMIEYIQQNPIKASLLFKKFINETDETISIEIKKEFCRLRSFELTQEECLQKIKKGFNNAYYKIKKQLNKQNT